MEPPPPPVWVSKMGSALLDSLLSLAVCARAVPNSTYRGWGSILPRVPRPFYEEKHEIKPEACGIEKKTLFIKNSFWQDLSLIIRSRVLRVCVGFVVYMSAYIGRSSSVAFRNTETRGEEKNIFRSTPAVWLTPTQRDSNVCKKSRSALHRAYYPDLPPEISRFTPRNIFTYHRSISIYTRNISIYHQSISIYSRHIAIYCCRSRRERRYICGLNEFQQLYDFVSYVPERRAG